MESITSSKIAHAASTPPLDSREPSSMPKFGLNTAEPAAANTRLVSVLSDEGAPQNDATNRYSALCGGALAPIEVAAHG